jgi:hypothetical protein
VGVQLHPQLVQHSGAVGQAGQLLHHGTVHRLAAATQQLQQARHAGRRSRQLPAVQLLLFDMCMQCALNLIHKQLSQAGQQGGMFLAQFLKGGGASLDDESGGCQALNVTPVHGGCCGILGVHGGAVAA